MTAGPLPKFDGLTTPAVAPAPTPGPSATALQAQSSGGPIRVPPLTPEKVVEYNSHFERSGAVNGMLPGMYWTHERPRSRLIRFDRRTSKTDIRKSKAS